MEPWRTKWKPWNQHSWQAKIRDKLSEELSEIPVKRTEKCKDLKYSFEKNVIKDMEQNSKEEFDFEYDKIHRHRKVNSTKQNVIVRFRLHQYPSDLYYALKKIKNL